MNSHEQPGNVLTTTPSITTLRARDVIQRRPSRAKSVEWGRAENGDAARTSGAKG